MGTAWDEASMNRQMHWIDWGFAEAGPIPWYASGRDRQGSLI